MALSSLTWVPLCTQTASKSEVCWGSLCSHRDPAEAHTGTHTAAPASCAPCALAGLGGPAWGGGLSGPPKGLRCGPGPDLGCSEASDPELWPGGCFQSRWGLQGSVWTQGWTVASSVDTPCGRGCRALGRIGWSRLRSGRRGGWTERPRPPPRARVSVPSPHSTGASGAP